MCFSKNLPVQMCGIFDREVDARDVTGITVDKLSNDSGRVRITMINDILYGKEYPLNVAYTLRRDLDSARIQIVYGD
jgi:hypothetical protein